MALTQVNLGMVDTAAAGGLGMRNRIINGAMEIDQRNAGASVTLTNGTDQYCVDRYKFYRDVGGTFTAQQSSTAPAGFSTSMVITASTGASPSASQLNFVKQDIEGFNVADLKWGTSDAKDITISFWIRSSVTGAYAISVANNSLGRSYVTEVTVSSANTWEQKSVTIPGDTSGTWTTNNTAGIRLYLDLGSGSDYNATVNTWASAWDCRTSSSVTWGATTGATLYITGVQLEVGSVATEFERRPYGTELQLCQRYYYQMNCYGTGSDNFYGRFVGIAETGTNVIFSMFWPSGEMRTTPTASYSGSLRMDDYYSANNPAGTFTSGNLTKWGGILQVSVASGSFTQGRTIRLLMNSTVGSLNFSAEL